MRILTVDDDDGQAKLIEAVLTGIGHQVEVVSSGRVAIRRMESNVVDLLILDRHLADLSGLDVLGWTRARVGNGLPILMLTSRGNVDEVSRMLEAGADDFMIKPLRQHELSARVEALLRRAWPDTRRYASRLELGDFVVDLRERTVTRCGHVERLTPREFDVASLLFRHPGRVFPREDICRAVWGRHVDTDSRTLDTHIYRLRLKLDLSSKHGVRLRSVYQHGYCLEEVSVPCAAAA